MAQDFKQDLAEFLKQVSWSEESDSLCEDCLSNEEILGLARSELDENARAPLELHLIQCAACKELVDFMRIQEASYARRKPLFLRAIGVPPQISWTLN